MKIVFNSSPLIFLSRLDYLDLFLQYDYQFYAPEVVINEINAKQDEASQYVNPLTFGIGYNLTCDSLQLECTEKKFMLTPHYK